MASGEPCALPLARLRLEEKVLDFEFEVLGVWFTGGRGRYTLCLTVESPQLHGAGAGGVRLRIGSTEEATRARVATTDVVEQRGGTACAFRRRRFVFTLPKGLCANDSEHEVCLRIEALRVTGRAAMRRVGRAFFAIYPRPGQPPVNTAAAAHEDLYRYRGEVPLLRVSTDRLARHCGKLAFAARFREHQLPPVQDALQALAAPRSPRILVPRRAPGHAQDSLECARRSLPAEDHARSHKRLPPAPEPSSSPQLPGDSADEHPSSSSSSFSSSSSAPAPRQLPSGSSFHVSSPGCSPGPSSAEQVAKSPAGMDKPPRRPESARWHVARAGKETVTVMLHGARNLPAPRAGVTLQPYVLVKTTGDKEQQEVRVTHVSLEPTHSPTWDETVTLEINAGDASQEALSLTVVDRGTREALAAFRLPLRHLRPFQHHHCCLALPRKGDPAGTSLYITIVRKGSAIPCRDGLDYAGLEVFLQGLTAPLASPMGALVAVASVIPDAQAYEASMAKRPGAPIPMSVVTFPEPLTPTLRSPRAALRGRPQVTSPAGPPEQPTWNTSFLFQGRDGATLFSDGAALAIEYYPRHALWDAGRTLGALGYSVLPLPASTYRRLVVAHRGLCVDDLAVRGTGMSTAAGATPTVRLCLRLLTSERPGRCLSARTCATFPSLDVTEPPRGLAAVQAHIRRRPEQAAMSSYYRPLSSGLHQGDVSLSPADAMAGILPILPEPEERRDQDGARERWDQEASGYRVALERMAADLLVLQRRSASLELENSRLRRELAARKDAGRALLHDSDTDVMTRAEGADRVAALQQRLAAGTAETRRLQDRVQQLQNQLIRKNDQEKDLVTLQRAQQQQRAALRSYQEKVAKMKGLQETVRQQEKLIQTMEQILEEQLSAAGRSTEKSAGEATAGELFTALQAENRWLREELARAWPHSRPAPEALGRQEKLSLLAKLERARAHGRVLQSQLTEAARRWAREKQELHTRLLERHHGFGDASLARDAAAMPAEPVRPSRTPWEQEPLP